MKQGVWIGLVLWSGLAAENAAAAKLPVWIDTDPSIGLPFRDVDDGIALIQALNAPELEIRGISTVFGNAPLAYAHSQALRIVARTGSGEVPGVYPGAAASSELGRETIASRALAAALARERLTLVGLGPMTNIGTVLKLHPELAARIERVLIFSGRRLGQRYPMRVFGVYSFENPDPNFTHDRAAFEALIASEVPLTIVPLEAAARFKITDDDLGALENRSSPVSPLREWLPWIQLWQRIWKWGLGLDGFIPYDPIVVAYAQWPGLFRCERLPVAIVQEEGDQKIRVSPEIPTSRVADYCGEAESSLKEKLIRLLAAAREREW